MTARELIDKLATFPPDAPVIYRFCSDWAELDDARPCPCCVPGCDGNADPRCKYRLCGKCCDEDCGRGDKCPRSDAKREGT